MTDYSNPQVMKEVMAEAKNAGIFNRDKTRRKYLCKLTLITSTNNLLSLEMFERDKYKLIQIDCDLGLSSKIKNTPIIKIDLTQPFFLKRKVVIEFIMEETIAGLAWMKTIRKVEGLYFIGKGMLNYLKINAGFEII